MPWVGSNWDTTRVGPPYKLYVTEFNNIVDHAFIKSVDYIVRLNGSVYEAINGATSKIDYGGSGSEGGVDGSDKDAVTQAAINAASGTVLLKGFTKGTVTIGANKLVIEHYQGDVKYYTSAGLEWQLSSGQEITVPFNDKIADINESDVLKHTLDLETPLGETRKIVSLQILVFRITGVGKLYVYPNEGSENIGQHEAVNHEAEVKIKEGTQRLQYSQTVADDDFDLYCYGYMVEV